jgi:hypothetical protein
MPRRLQTQAQRASLPPTTLAGDRPSKAQTLLLVLRTNQTNDPRHQRVRLRKRLLRQIVVKENKHHAHQRRRHDRNLHYGQRPPLQQAGNADSCSAVGMAFEVVAVDVIEDWTGDAAC